ncbi:hypothetical protein [Roseicyclus amphidinii]|uniref:hypothetical protein n=1 Tax=Roseicyclus amphidinii TaxID=3034232 RepID=UPI0024E0619E|nr:hypothetical protein [Roseicyclus sp. Amp-Y-6]
MTIYTTRTAELGQITFSAPAATETYDGYVWVETNDGRRRQICEGGGFMGGTVTAKSGDLKKAAQKWMRQRRQN